MRPAEEGVGEGMAGLVGPPTFSGLPNGRVKCVETGHEMVAGDAEGYTRSKRCRLGLIDFAVAHGKKPLHMFKQDPLCRSKLICKLTGDRVNKSEKHIWNHINGRRFLSKLEQKEVEIDKSKQKLEENVCKKKGQNTRKTIDEIRSQMRDPQEDNGLPGEPDDHGQVCDVESDQESDEHSGTGREDFDIDSGNISMGMKRMSIEIGPSSFASRKKKPKKDISC